MKIAAILPAYNEEARIADVLRSVRRSLSIDEIIVVNDGSTDNTAAIVELFEEVYLVNLPENISIRKISKIRNSSKENAYW